MTTPILGLLTLTSGQTGKEASINANFESLEKSMNQQIDVDFSAGNVALPTIDFQRYFTFTSTGLTVARTLTVPNVAARLFFVDNRAGTDTLTVNAGGGSTVLLNPGEVAFIQSVTTEVTLMAKNVAVSYYADFRGGRYQGTWATSDRTIQMNFEDAVFKPYVALGGSVLPTIVDTHPDAVGGFQYSAKIGFCNYLATSSMEWDVDVPVGGGDLVVRLEFVGGNYGTLRVQVDAVDEYTINDVAAYAEQTIAMTAGPHTITLVYDHFSAAGQTTTGAYVSVATFDTVAPVDFVQGDTVTYDGLIWMALIDEVLAAPGTDGTKWVALNNPLILPNDQIGTTYTLGLSDLNEVVRCNNASPVTVTVPLNATTAFDIGTVIAIRQVGAGQVTLSPESGSVTLNTPETLKTRKQGSSISVHKVGTNEWDVSGDLEAV